MANPASALGEAIGKSVEKEIQKIIHNVVEPLGLFVDVGGNVSAGVRAKSYCLSMIPAINIRLTRWSRMKTKTR